MVAGGSGGGLEGGERRERKPRLKITVVMLRTNRSQGSIINKTKSNVYHSIQEKIEIKNTIYA